jgi:ribonuclease VapC
MIVDTSALCTILFQESDRDTFVAAMEDAESLFMSAATLFELHLVAMGRLRLEGEVRTGELLTRFGIAVVAFDAEQERIARRGFHRYGKGRHPAGLNFGDCFAYALAKHLGEPLLFKGDDFRKTDVTPAV